MRKILPVLGVLFAVCSILFLLMDTYVLTGTPGDSVLRDIFGLPIPQPPVWISYIPYLGTFLGFIFEFFSMHGVVALTIFIAGMFVATQLIRIGASGGQDSSALSNERLLTVQEAVAQTFREKHVEEESSAKQPAELGQKKDWVQQLVDNLNENLKNQKD